MKGRKYVVTKYFEGLPKREDYEIEEYDLPELEDGEILAKAEWISVDPYLRAYNRYNTLPYDQFSFQIAVVLESKNPDYPVGTKVVSHEGWRDYTIFKPGPEEIYGPNSLYKLPELEGLSESMGCNGVGVPGVTAYFGFLEICKPEPGETVVVTGAAGAVGSLVGQIAKIKGCKVIGFAGSDEKVEWLEKELGFDKAFNYKTVNVCKALTEAAANGVDCYFDNVGGELSSCIIHHMNDFGRVSVCGSISSYNDDPSNRQKATLLQPAIVARQLIVVGFLISRWSPRWPEAFSEVLKWIKSGQIKTREHVTEGFDALVDAFVGMLKGENIGKALVKV